MRCGQNEVVIGRQQRQLVTNAELRNQGVNRANLQARATTAISQFRGIDVILSVRGQKRQRHEPVNDIFTRPRTGESLQQFLQDQPRGHDRIAPFKAISQRAHLRSRGSSVASERKRPDAGIDEQIHRRERSAL